MVYSNFSITMANLIMLTGYTEMLTESAMPLNTLLNPKEKSLHMQHLL